MAISFRIRARRKPRSFNSERQVQPHLQEARASNRVLNDAQTAAGRIQKRRCVIKELHVAVRRVETRVIEKIEGVEVVAEMET
jgi:hypothetical protein